MTEVHGHHEHEETDDCLDLVTIFQSLPEDDLAKISTLVSDRHFKTGEYIFSAGDPADTLTIVAHGQAKVFQIAANGREQMLRVLQTGDFDGEAALFTSKDRTSFAQALMDTNVCQIHRSDFQNMMKSSPDLALNMMNAFGKRLVKMEQQTTESAVSSVEGRLANYLLETGAGLKQDQFELPLKKKDVATYLGTTPETISRKLKSLDNQGLIEKKSNTEIKILDADGLAMVE